MRPQPIAIKKTLFVLFWFVIAGAEGIFQPACVSAETGNQTVTLKIDGMTCGSCVKDARAALQKAPGVKTVEIKVGTKWGLLNDYADAKAVITFDPGQTSVEGLIKVIESASTALSTYRARAVSAG
ncbi:MAG: heavy-metal-associated domain-containing protein [Nitrospira sp.]|nr:heavy-metal-associated domain-containing protein [Nitrospira sp.]